MSENKNDKGKKYVLKRNYLYVARFRRRNSYTTKLKYAQVFNSREEAEKRRCRNEVVVEYDKEVARLLNESR